MPAESVAEHRLESTISIEIPGCMKQHLIVFIPNYIATCREYLSACVACLQLKFDVSISKMKDRTFQPDCNRV